MSFQITPQKTLPKTTYLFFPILIAFFLILSHGTIAAVLHNKTTSIGAIIDNSTLIGKEVETAIKIAVQQFNNHSMDHKLFLNFQNPKGNPLQAAYAAKKLVEENEVDVILCMQSWPETALVAEIGNQFQVPIISFAEASITPQFLPVLQWPFLVNMASNVSEQIKCIASIIHSFHWKRVIAIYESDKHGGDLGLLPLLSEELQKFGSEIEYRVVLPPFSSLSDPERFVREEIEKLLSQQARVFVVLHSSLPMATHLFSEAKKMKLFGKDSAWIMTESISGLLDSASSNFIASTEGSIGVITNFSEESRPFLVFKDNFRQSFRSEYPEELDDHYNLVPGIHAVRAYDSINVITKALERLNRSTSFINSTMMLKNILSSNFVGLSGPIGFHGGEQISPILRIVNVVGKRYKDVGFWSSKIGFFKSQESHEVENNGSDHNTMEVLASMVDWPGKVKSVPKGWAMPSDAEPIKLGVPGRTAFGKSVKVDGNGTSNKDYSGFCIDVFNEVLQLLDYSFPYEFHPYNGTYDDLVHHVVNKSYDGVIGDVTILANRSKYVEFTQPFSESSLTMVAPVKSQAAKAWIFLKPFTLEMWIVTGAILIYTMSIVWLLERQANPEFEGPWKYQLGTALWFTFSSLFFAHRERVHSNYTRMVVVVWLFVVLALSSSYTASLSSMLTVSKLQPDVTDIGWLKRNNKPVGCDIESFVWDYLQNVLNFNSSNIKNISSEYDYPDALKSGNITVAFLELPYEKAFLNHYCKGYTGTILEDRFGGLGFVFQKGSPIAADFSEAILNLSENGRLKQLETKWFGSSPNCLTSQTPTANKDIDSLSIQSFWGLYLFSGTISTICFVMFYVHQLRERCTSLNINNVWNKIVRMAKRVRSGGIRIPWRAQSGSHVFPINGDNSSIELARSERGQLSKTMEQLDVVT